MLKIATIVGSYFERKNFNSLTQDAVMAKISRDFDYIFFTVADRDTWEQFIRFSKITHSTEGGCAIVPIIIPHIDDKLLKDIISVVKSKIEVGFYYTSCNRDTVSKLVKILNQKSTILITGGTGVVQPPPFPVDLWSYISSETHEAPTSLFGEGSIHNVLSEHVKAGWPKLSFLMPTSGVFFLATNKTGGEPEVEMLSLKKAEQYINAPDSIFVLPIKHGKTGSSTYCSADGKFAIFGEDDYSIKRKIKYIDETRLSGLLFHDPLSCAINSDDIPRSRKLDSPGLVSDRRRVRRLLRIASPESGIPPIRDVHK